MSPDPVEMLARSVERLSVDIREDLADVRSDVKDDLTEIRREMNHRFDEANKKIDAVKSDTSATNGRVRVIEIWKARSEGFKAAFRWAETLVAAAIAAGATAAVTLIFK